MVSWFDPVLFMENHDTFEYNAGLMVVNGGWSMKIYDKQGRWITIFFKCEYIYIYIEKIMGIIHWPFQIPIYRRYHMYGLCKVYVLGETPRISMALHGVFLPL
jgi:hypothetical protein